MVDKEQFSHYYKEITPIQHNTVKYTSMSPYHTNMLQNYDFTCKAITSHKGIFPKVKNNSVCGS